MRVAASQLPPGALSSGPNGEGSLEVKVHMVSVPAPPPPSPGQGPSVSGPVTQRGDKGASESSAKSFPRGIFRVKSKKVSDRRHSPNGPSRRAADSLKSKSEDPSGESSNSASAVSTPDSASGSPGNVDKPRPAASAVSPKAAAEELALLRSLLPAVNLSAPSDHTFRKLW